MTKSITGLKGDGTSNSGGIAPIDAAKNAKNLIEQDNQRAIQQLK